MKLFFKTLLLCLVCLQAVCFQVDGKEVNVHYELGSAGLNIRIAFLNGKSINAIFGTDRQLTRYWISGVPTELMFLSRTEQILLRKHLVKLAPAKNDSEESVVKLIEFSADVIPSKEIIHPYQTTTRFSLAQAWTSICSSYGQDKIATYTVGSQVFNVMALVGDTKRCTGRCGTGCWQLGQKNANQYTQECLNHDICKDITGQNLGVCEDEFWAAAPGYLHAPNCF